VIIPDASAQRLKWAPSILRNWLEINGAVSGFDIISMVKLIVETENHLVWKLHRPNSRREAAKGKTVSDAKHLQQFAFSFGARK
jgi:hypothetical protein